MGLSQELSRELVVRVGPKIQKEKTPRATSSLVKDSHHPKIPGHKRLLQDPHGWLQGGLQFHPTSGEGTPDLWEGVGQDDGEEGGCF